MKKLTKLQQICPYCHSYADEDKLDINSSDNYWLGMPMCGTAEYYVNGITVMASEKFKFCPMCGRCLDEE